MNRRGFLKFLGIGAGTAVIAPKIMAETQKAITAFRPEPTPNICFPYVGQDPDLNQFLTGPYAEGGWLGGDGNISGVGRPDPILLSREERQEMMRTQIASHYYPDALTGGRKG